METILLTKEQIEEIVENVAIEINQLIYKYNMKTPILMCVLDGSFRFYSDTIKQIKRPVICDFIKVTSYTKNVQDEIDISKFPKAPISGKDIILIDDIFDTGRTMRYLIDELKPLHPKSISIVTLLARKHSVGLPSNYIHINGHIIDTEWVAGYGMDDFQGTSRNLNYIYQINNEENGN